MYMFQGNNKKEKKIMTWKILLHIFYNINDVS